MMRRTLLLQGELGEVPLPKLGPRGVIQVLDTRSRKEREDDALDRLEAFRDGARQRAVHRLLREARQRLKPQRVGEAEVFNLTEADGELIAEVLARVEAKFWPVRVSFLVINENSCLMGERGPVALALEPGVRYWQRLWTVRNVELVAIFVPSDFGESEPLLIQRDGKSEISGEKPSGRTALVRYLVSHGYLDLLSRCAPGRFRRRLKKWDLHRAMSLEQYMSRLLDVMREP